MILLITIDFLKVMVGLSDQIVLSEHIIRSLELLDITMVANLIWYVSAGSYYVFVHPHSEHPDDKSRPRSLLHISSGLLKEKMAGSLIGVSSVHLLQVFLNMYMDNKPIDIPKLSVMLAIHMTFIVGLLVFNYCNMNNERKSH